MIRLLLRLAVVAAMVYVLGWWVTIFAVVVTLALMGWRERPAAAGGTQ